jgi:hypothetical protein
MHALEEPKPHHTATILIADEVSECRRGVRENTRMAEWADHG